MLGVTTVSAAGAATFHRLAATQTSGSEGALAILQTGATGSALQGEVASSANTAVKYPFGVLGEYDAAGSTFGIGVIGLSTTGYAVGGESLSDTQPSIIAYPGGNGVGLEAFTQATSSSPAMYALSKGSGDGIDAVVNNSRVARAAIFGADNTDSDSATDGVLGTTIDDGYGVEGTSSDNAIGGVHGFATTGVGVQANSEIGDAIDAGSVDGYALYGTTQNNTAGYFENNSPSEPTLSLQSDGDSPLVEADASGCGGSCLILDGSGDLQISGKLVDASGMVARTRNPNSDAMSYGEQSTEPTIEDVGRAKLVNGSAAVPIAPDFRATIDNSDYMVFLTPHGDSNGLYIASESAAGFVVKESHGGRSTLAFDYRIVAQQYGAHDGRLPHYASLHRSMPSATATRARILAKATRLSVNKQQAILRASNKRPFVPPPVMPLVQPASFSLR